MKTNTLLSAIARNLCLLTLLASGFWQTCSATSLTMLHNGTDFEGHRNFELQWTAIPNARYGIQFSTNLESGSWETADIVTPTSAEATYKVPPSIRGVIIDKRLFSRLVLPQPQVFDAHPAFIDSSSTSPELFLTGQLLPTNAIVLINGQVFNGTNDGSGNLRIGLNGLPPGTPVIGTITVMDGASNVVTTFTVQSPIYFGTAMTEEQLSGPATEPPASPQAIIVAWLSKKGYDYYRASSDLHSATIHNNPYFVESHNPGQMLDVSGLKMKAKEKANRTKCGNNLRIVPPTGEVQIEEADFIIPGIGLDFAWTRTYRSRTTRTTAQGAGWDFSYNVKIQPLGGDILLHSGNGRADLFYPNGTNGWTRDEYFCEIRDLNQDSMPDVLFADTGKWLFNPTGPAAGKLWKIIDRNTNTITLNYDGSGRLAQIVDDLGRTNTVAYNGAGQISSVTDFSGRTVRYEYDGNGDLTKVVSPAVTGTITGNDFPGGITNRYTYSSGFPPALDALNHNLTSCIDGKGQTWLSVTYQPTNNPASLDYDRAGNLLCGSTTHFFTVPQPPTPTNNFATVKSIIRDGAGNVTESFYDSRGRCVRLLEYTGRAPSTTTPTTETVNRPVNKLRVDDPDTFETRWSWNRDSLCTLETRPDGGQTRCLYQQEFGQANPRKKGDLRVVRKSSSSGPVDLDGDGVGDTDELAWHFDHDPNFGSGGKYGRVKVQFHWDREGKKDQNSSCWVRSARDGLGIKDWEIGDWAIYNGTAWGKVDNSDTPTGSLREHNPSLNYSAGDTVIYNDTIARAGSGRVKVQFHWDREGKKNESDACFGRKGWDGFVTSATDPRGIVTTAEFDANGNCTKSIKTGHYAVSNFQVEIDGAYNSRGQLTAVTNAADANGYRPVTRLEYGSNAFPTTVVFDADASGLKITNSADYTPVGVLSRRIDPLGNDWLYTYNALDQLIRAESPTNVAARSKVDFLYDANGNVSSTIEELRDDTDAFVRNVVTSYEYNSLDECTAMIEQVSPGVTITNKFFRNGIGELIRVESPLAASGVDPYAAVEFQYDERGLLFREIEAPGGGSSGTNEWSYTAAYHPATKKYVDATASLTTTFAYDGFAGSSVGQPIKLPMLSGCLEGIDIAAKGSRPIEFPMLETCPDGISRAAGNGRISSITDPMGNVTTFNYDANSNLKLVRHYGQTNDVPGTNGNTLLAQSSYAYDGLDRLVTQHDAHFDIVGQTIGDGYRTTSFTYAPNGARTSVTDDLGRTTSFYYDTAGRGTNVTSPGQRTSFAILLDGGGRPVKCTQTDRSDLPGPLQVFARTNVFDSLGRCVQTVDNVGNTNRVFLDSFSRVVKASDAKNNFSFGEYDDLGRSQKWTINLNPSGSPDPDGVQTTYSYDANSRLVSMTDDNTNTTYVAYDSLNHPTQLTLADGTHRTLVWSPRSNLILQQDANGTVISNSFDALNRCVRRDITPGAGVANTTTFTSYAYDGLSRVVAATNNAAYRTIQRDSLGWPAKWSLSELDASKVHDSEGNCLSMTYPSGRIVSYAYNSLNQVTNVSSSPGIGQPFTSLASLDYDGPGRIARISRANGINTRISWNGLAGVANAQGDFGWGQISGINHQVAGGGAIIDRRVMSYDRNQNKTSRKQTAPFAVGQPMLTNLWSHDALDRVAYSFAGKPMMIEDTYEFTLDGNGNRQVVTSNGVAQLYSMDATPPPGPADFQVNQYTITPFASQTYDENGNMLSRSSTAQQLMYEYDFADRLVSVADVTSGSAVPVADYAYGPFGERVSKTVYSTSPIIPPTTTTYVYAKSKESCGNGIIDPGEGCDDSVLEIRVNGALIDSYINVVDDRGLLGLREHNGAIQHYILDDLGNTLALADSGGGVIERFDYGDFGEPRFLNAIGLPTGTNSSSAGNPFLFLGMEWDSETGLYSLKLKTKLGGTFDKIKNNPILRQRAPASGGYYDPQTGRDNSGGNSTRAGISTSRSNIRQKNGFFSGSDDPNAAKVPRAILKTFFQTGDKPTQAEVKVLPLTYPAKTGKTGKTK